MQKPNFTFLKTIAIICVFFAHVNNNAEESIFVLFGTISSIGVPLFLFILGYHFDREKKNKSIIYNKKFYFAWYFWATIIFIVTSVYGTQTSSISVVHWLTYILGYQSIFYFNTIMVLLIIVSFKIDNLKIMFIILFVLNIVILKTDIISKQVYLFGYLNPLFWASYFLLGVVAKPVLIRYNKLQTNLVLIIVLLVILIYSSLSTSSGYSYFSLSSFIFCTSSILILTIISYNIKIRRNIFEKNTLFIYLTHLPLAGILSGLYLINYGFSVLIRVSILIILYSCILIVFKFFSRILSTKFPIFITLSGYLGLRL